MLTNVLAVEWAKYGINVNSISPAIIETPMLSRLKVQDPKTWQRLDARFPLKRVGQPEDVANSVVFLASSASDYVTAQDIRVDGGMLAVHQGFVE